MASDGTLELAHAFLNSFRSFNPEILLCLVEIRGKTEAALQLAVHMELSCMEQLF